MADKSLIYVGSEGGGDFGGALYRKEAGGDSWQRLTESGLPPDPTARAIAIHPQNPDMVYVGTQRGVYVSNDRGDHWHRADMAEGRVVWSIVFHPDNPRVMYLGTEGSEVYRSDDGVRVGSTHPPSPTLTLCRCSLRPVFWAWPLRPTTPRICTRPLRWAAWREAPTQGTPGR